ncbi:MAG: SLC13 family permease [Lachnospiraceae bacterium]
MTLTVSLIAIVVAIVLGWKFKVNAGIIGMGFAFIISVFLIEGGKVSAVISYWPTSIVFYLIAIALFFNYATGNGTMDLLAKNLLYSMNGNARMIPWVISLVCAVVAFLGAGASTPAIIGPLAFSIGLGASLHPILIAICVACATTIGGDNPINGFGGVISKGLIEQTAYADAANEISYYIWFNSCIKQLFVILAVYIIFKGYKAKRVEVEKPEPFNPVQKKQLMIIVIALIAMVVPTILNTWIKTPAIALLAQLTQPQSVMVFAAIASVFLKLGDEKDVIRKIPMNTIILIAGMYMLLSVAKDAGMVEAISNIMSNSIPRVLVPAALVGFAAFLSFFSSGTGVVCPLLYPMVEHLAMSMGLNPVMLFSCIFVGAMSSSVSPFSTGGAMTIAGCQDLKVKEQLSNWMIPVAIIIPIVCAILGSIGVFSLFNI